MADDGRSASPIAARDHSTTALRVQVWSAIGALDYHPTMYAEPVDLDREQLIQILRAEWGLVVSSLRYEPVGFGTHHYRAGDQDGTDWFVNVDELAAKASIADDERGALVALERALGTAVALRTAGLEFVHAPVERRHGGPVASLAGKYAVSVYAFIVGSSNPYGEFPSDDERRRVLGMLGRMHAATHAVPPGAIRRDKLEVPLRQPFFEALGQLSSPWSGGPFAEPARRLLRENAGTIRELFDRHDDLVRAVRGGDDAWVVTHGEPHAANVMRTTDGKLLLIDWDTAALGPRERDLWMVEPKSDDDWTAYASSGGAGALDRSAIALYRLWWTLTEITGYTEIFRSQHEDNENTRAAWANLQTYVPSSP
jgi:spectinomycin phosphotransferase